MIKPNRKTEVSVKPNIVLDELKVYTETGEVSKSKKKQIKNQKRKQLRKHNNV